MGKTVGIIIIGDEILSGKIHDNNSFFMAKELWLHGIHVRRICIIPDDVNEIAQEVQYFSEMFDYVFTSGGIGPTHDDVTIEGISKAFNVKPVIHDTLRKILEQRHNFPTPEQLKMAEVPEGAELVNDGTLSFPLIKFKNIFIFPGIPEFLKKKFSVIVSLFHEPPIRMKKIYVNENESTIASILNEILDHLTDVKIGSYPVVDNRDYQVMITFESLHEDHLDQAVRMLLERLPQEKIVRSE
jgi:molybdenum cofactor synthesis domain-containing protein